MRLFLILLCSMVLLCNPAFADIDKGKTAPGNPAPAEGDLIIPGPDGYVFAFRPVNICASGNGADGPLSGVRFIMGDPSGDFRSPPTAVVIGGAFEKETGSQKCWTYYLGKYEITRGQYAAVMGQNAMPPIKESEDLNLPVANISYFDAMRFVDALNMWFYSNSMQNLPHSGPYPGFVRLPTEVEWEFGARGGQNTEAVVFDASHPYGDELAAYEWFAGPNSSHNRIKPVGALKPNPLGIHDMLGNVREMTLSQYHVEYYQGRTGGFAARGGHYLVAEKDISCALRTEEPYYLGSVAKGMRPNLKPTMGMRLCMSAPVLTDRDSIAAIEDAWENHRSGAGASMPAGVSIADVAKQEAVPASDALDRFAKIKAALQTKGLLPGMERDFDAAEIALRQISQIRRRADQDSAKVWVKIAAERGLYLNRNLRGLTLVQNAPSEKLRARAEQFAYNVTSGLASYGEIMSELGKLPPDVVFAAFDAHADYLSERIKKDQSSDDARIRKGVEDIVRQKDVWLPVTRAHYENYGKGKRFDAAKWRSDYAAGQ